MTTEIGDPVRGWVWVRWDTGKSYDYRGMGSRERLGVGSVWDTGKSYDYRDSGYRERFGVDSVGHGDVI